MGVGQFYEGVALDVVGLTAEGQLKGPLDLGGPVIADIPLEPLGQFLRLHEHEAVVEQGEGLEGRHALVSLCHPHRGIRAVEAGHEGLRLAADDEAIDTASPAARVAWVGEIVAVVGRVLRMLDHKVLPAGAAHRQVECARRGEHGIADRLSLQPPPVLPPEETVVGVGRCGILAGCRNLPVGAAGHDQPVQVFERSAAIAKHTGEPVEELRVRRLAPHPAEVVGGVDEAASEVVVPDAVDQAPPDQRIGGIGEPPSKRCPAVALGMIGRQVKAALQALDQRQRSRRDLAGGGQHAAA